MRKDIEIPKLEFSMPELESRITGTPMGPMLLSKVQGLMVLVEQERVMNKNLEVDVRLLECVAYLNHVRIEIYKQRGI